MKSSTYRIKLTRLLVLGAFVVGAVASVAAASDVRSPNVADAATALNTTPTGLKAYGERWEGIAQVYRGLELAQSTPSAQGMQADGLRWQGIAQVYRGLELSANGPTPQGTKADGLRWQGMAAVFQQMAQGEQSSAQRPHSRAGAPGVGKPAIASVSGTSFDWGDWAIGLGAGLGMALGIGGALKLAPRIRKTSAVAAR